MIDYAVFASYGNDSVALIQYMHEQRYGKTVTIAYSDTGWWAANWPARVDAGELWARSLGFQTVRIASEGMQSLVERKKAWPRGGGGKFQFCTHELKEKPALAWLDANEVAAKDAVCVIGIRREESDN